MHRLLLAWCSAGLAFWLSACDDPTALRPVPDQDRSLVVALVLNADSVEQPLLIRSVDTDGRFAGYVRGELYDDTGTRLAAGGMETVPDPHEITPTSCIHRYGILWAGSATTCIPLAFTPRFGARYHLRVVAEGRPTVEATTTLPGDFGIISAITRGLPPGTAGLEAEWTESAGAYRYLIALRAAEFVCYNVRGCLDGWFTETESTTISTIVPVSGLAEGKGGPWHLDIYAVDRALYEYLTTGSGGGLFPVQPVQNITGGYGVFGAYTRRSVRVRPR